MSNKDQKVVYVAEEVFEVRYKPVGSFLNVTGQVADYIEHAGLFPVWNINNSIVEFKESAALENNTSAWVTFKNAGYASFDAPTRSFFADKARAYWKAVEKNPYYKIPVIQRRGLRNRCFISLEQPFEALENSLFKALFAESAQKKIGGTRTDLQVVFSTKENGYQWTIGFGPMKPDEAYGRFRSRSEHFENAGMYFDIDIFTTDEANPSEVSHFIKTASEASWEKIEKLAGLVGV